MTAQEKECPRCHRMLPLTKEHWRYCVPSKGRRRASCRRCENELRMEKRLAKKAIEIASGNVPKRKMPDIRDTCAVCGKPIELPRRAYCSKECQHKGSHANEAAAIRLKRRRELDSTGVIESVDEFEEWRPISGYEGEYEVSSYGRVRTLGFFRTTKSGKQYPVKPRILKQSERKGYLHVSLPKNGKYRRFRVHRLVAKAFIDNPHGKPDVNHIDCNKANNRVENLEWVTPKENTAHAIAHGLVKSNPRPDARGAHESSREKRR